VCSFVFIFCVSVCSSVYLVCCCTKCTNYIIIIGRHRRYSCSRHVFVLTFDFHLWPLLSDPSPDQQQGQLVQKILVETDCITLPVNAVDRVPPSRCTSAFWQVRHGARDPAAARRFTRPSFPRPAASDGGGGGDSPARRPGADGRCVSPVTLPRTPRPFWECHCRLCWSSAGGVGVTSSAGNGAGSGRWSPLPPSPAPAGDPTPITQVKVRTRAKSTTGFSLSKPVPGFKTGYRFSGSRITSLIQIVFWRRTSQPISWKH